MKISAKFVHRASAVVLMAYALLHMANHLAGLAGVATHQAVMNALRLVYRAPPIEVLLLTCVVLQLLTGLWLFVAHARWRTGALNWLQAGSGLVLGMYLAVHVIAVLYGRYQLHLDTNFYYAAAGTQLASTRAFFAPYYFVGVLALFVHGGCALHRWLQRHRATAAQAAPISVAATVGTAAVVGAVLAAVVVLLLMGVLIPIQVPAAYLATFAEYK